MANKLKTFLGNMGDTLSPSTKNERLDYENKTRKTQRQIDMLVKRNMEKKKRREEKKLRDLKAKEYMNANPQKDGDPVLSAIELEKRINK